MKTRFELNVIQPQITACSENWENMLPHEKGALCTSCNKVVHDLENLNAEQLANFLVKHQNTSICGRVQADVINKPVTLIYKQPEKYSQPFLFTITLFIVFGCTLFSCDEKEHTIIKSTIENTFFEMVELNRATDKQEFFVSHTGTYSEIINLEEPVVVTGERDSTPIALNEVVVSRTTKCLMAGGLSYTIRTIYHEMDTTPIAPLIQEPPIEFPLLVFPNPARENATIKYTITEEGFSVLTLFNVSGQKVMDIFSQHESSPGVYTQQFDVSDLPSGMYLFILINNEKKEVFRVSVTH